MLGKPFLLCFLAVTPLLSNPVRGQSRDCQADGETGIPHREDLELRRQLWLQRKLEKLEEMKSYEVGPVERIFLAFEGQGLGSQGLDLGLGGFSPALESPLDGAGLAAGVRYGQMIGSSPLGLAGRALYSLEQYGFLDLQLGYLKGPRPAGRFSSDLFDPLQTPENSRAGSPALEVYTSFGYRYFPDEAFFGLGMSSDRKELSLYRFTSRNVDLASRYAWTDALAVNLKAGLWSIGAGPGSGGEFPDTGAVFPQLFRPAADTDFFRLTSSLVADDRDHPGNTRSGGLASLGFERFASLGGGRHSFNRVSADLRRYVSLGSDQRVLAVRGAAEFSLPDAGSRIPFYLMSSLGGPSSLRGFADRRFRARNMLLLSAEYRWEVLSELDMALFLDSGKVFTSPGAFNLSGMEQGYGLGFRLKGRDRIWLRLDFGFSREGHEIYLQMGPSF